MLYDAVFALQAVGWILIGNIALKNKLCKSEKAVVEMASVTKFGYFAFILYSLCTIIAFWFPHTIAAVTAFSWLFWLAYGISIKHE